MKKLRSYRLTSSLCAVLLMLVFASCKDDKEKSATHDPNKPITLTKFLSDQWRRGDQTYSERG